jgi:hypothetical protein
VNALRILVALLVTIVWVGVYATAIFRPDFSAPPEVSGVMLMVVTYLFGRALREGLNRAIKEKGQRMLDILVEDEEETNERR